VTLFIQNDVGGVGTGTVLPNSAEANIFTIGKMDTALGEETQPAPSDLIKVTYGAQTENGAGPDRLHDLVNTDFAGVAGTIDIIVLAVDDSFTLTDGSVVSQSAGVTLPVGDALNPTNSVLVVYDPAPPVCVKNESSSAFDVPFPGPVVLFHELSHARRMATSSLLSLTATGCAASPEENAAEIDENAVRDQLGIAHRDANDHCGGPCGSSESCCIVASIATGSHSEEVNSLRLLRNRFLRRSEVGYDFFERLHYDYYAFSPQVCTAMGQDPELVENVARYCVRPLTASLRLLQAHLMEDLPAADVGREIVGADDGLEAVDEADLDTALALLRRARTRGDGGESEFVTWALLAPIEIYMTAVADRVSGLAADAIGRRFADRVARWAPELPLTDVWALLSDYDMRAELDFLAKCLLRTPYARRRFATRLLETCEERERIGRVLADAGYLREVAA
jgi:hypothetical protein